MANGKVLGIFIAPTAGAPMQELREVEAIIHAGLKGDRYCNGEGSFNRGDQGKRQVTLINDAFFECTGYGYADCRRNLVTQGVELMWLIGREFKIGTAHFRGVKYCEPCTRPNALGKGKLHNVKPFNEQFHDRGGLIAEVIQGGIIRLNDPIIPPPKNY